MPARKMRWKEEGRKEGESFFLGEKGKESQGKTRYETVFIEENTL